MPPTVIHRREYSSCIVLSAPPSPPHSVSPEARRSSRPPWHRKQPAPLSRKRDIDTVVVLGTARADKTELTSTAPVDVITPEQLRETGAVTINQALSRLHPSFNFPQGQNAVKGQGVRAASLRGVRTRLHAGAGERKASSRVGTALRHRSVACRAGRGHQHDSVQLGGTHRGAARWRGRAVRLGRDRWRHQHRARKTTRRAATSPHASAVTATAVAARISCAGTKGFQLGETGFLNFNIDRLDNQQRRSQRSDWRQLFPTGDPRNTTFDAKYGQWGQSSRDNWVGLINGEREITSNLTAYGWANYADKSADNYVNPERMVKANTGSPTATTPNRVSETAVIGVYPDGYQPWMRYAAKDSAAVVGLQLQGRRRWARSDFSVVVRPERNGALDVQHHQPELRPDQPDRASISARGRATRPAPRWIILKDLNAVVRELVACFPPARCIGMSSGARATSAMPAGYTSGPLGGRTVASLYGAGGIYQQYAS